MGKKKFKKAFKNRPFYDKLVIPIEIFQTIRALTMEAKGEISGFGRTVLVDEGMASFGTAVLVKEFEVFNQKCEPLHTTLKKEDLHAMYYGVAKESGKPEEWNFWWHSHVEMTTGFSGEDDKTMEDITKAKNGQGGSRLVALCTNKFGDYDATIYQNGKRLMEHLPLIILPDLNETVMAEAKRIIKEKVDYTEYKHFKAKYNFGGKSLQDDDFDFEFEKNLNSIPAGYAPIVNLNLSKNQRRKLERYSDSVVEEEVKFASRPKGWNIRP